MNQRGDAPTIQTDFYILFGYVEVKMRASSGTGVVSSIVLESDDLDEVDWVSLFLYDRLVANVLYNNPLTNDTRNSSAATTPRFRPTTSAKATPRPTTV